MAWRWSRVKASSELSETTEHGLEECLPELGRAGHELSLAGHHLELEHVVDL